MSSLSNLLCFELTRLGAAYQIIQSAVDNTTLRVFEMSPTPSGAILILAASDRSHAESFFKKITSEFKETLLFQTLVQLEQAQVLEAYLSQNKTKCDSQIAIFEMESVSQGFHIASQLSQLGIQVLDFRVLRSASNRTIVIATDSELKNKISQNVDLKKCHPTIIDQPNSAVRSFFELL